MSMSTSLRFEVMTENKSLHAHLQRQQERIRMDDENADREKQAKVEAAINLKSDWEEKLEQVTLVNKMKAGKKQTQAELKLAQKATINVRRKAMSELFEKEHKQYESELQGLGKSFYIKRQ